MSTITIEIDLQEEVSNLRDDDFVDLYEWMQAEHYRRFCDTEFPKRLMFNSERIYRALQHFRKNEINDGRWELERAFQ